MRKFTDDIIHPSYQLIILKLLTRQIDIGEKIRPKP